MIKDSEREARQVSNMDFIGGEARGGANGVVWHIRHGKDGRPCRSDVHYKPWLTFEP